MIAVVRRTEPGRRAGVPVVGWCGPWRGSRGSGTRSSFRLGPTRVPGAGRSAVHRTGRVELSDLSSSVAPVLKLGLRLELYRSPTVQVPYDLVQRAEELGFHSVWTAEAYGADALTPLAAIAARDASASSSAPRSCSSPAARRRCSACRR